MYMQRAPWLALASRVSAGVCQILRRRGGVRFATALATVLVLPTLAVAATYEVGPGRPYSSIGSVPWESLVAGDLVLIHWRSVPYREKWVIGGRGTASAPIVVRGVPAPDGARPLIDGSGATTRTALRYWNQNRGLLKIGGSSAPAGTPAHIVVENLEFANARAPLGFIDSGGQAQTYATNAAAIYIEGGENLTIRNCVIRDSGNGLFVGPSAAGPARAITVERNHIGGNGNVGSAYEHNVYTSASGIVFQLNRLAPLRAGASGNNLKDRSSGFVARYNWIEGGNRQLDLVDAGDSLVQAAGYRASVVYGNVLIEPPGDGNQQIVHYGGDSGVAANYRKGTLYFHHNTVVTRRTDRTTLFRASTNDETIDARNNIVFSEASGAALALLDTAGRVALGGNWMPPGWVTSFGTFSGTLTVTGPNTESLVHCFADLATGDYRVRVGTSCVDAGIDLAVAVAAAHSPTQQYVKHLAGAPRVLVGLPDAGAYEAAGAELPPPPSPAPSPAPTNAAPVVRLTSPSGSLSIQFGAWQTLTAEAGDSDGKVSKVEFYLDQKLLRRDTVAPYSYQWKATAVGTYSLTAVAIDDKGARTRSAPVTITVR